MQGLIGNRLHLSLGQDGTDAGNILQVDGSQEAPTEIAHSELVGSRAVML